METTFSKFFLKKVTCYSEERKRISEMKNELGNPEQVVSVASNHNMKGKECD